MQKYKEIIRIKNDVIFLFHLNDVLKGQLHKSTRFIAA